jgi:hypothetical protein
MLASRSIARPRCVQDSELAFALRVMRERNRRELANELLPPRQLVNALNRERLTKPLHVVLNRTSPPRNAESRVTAPRFVSLSRRASLAVAPLRAARQLRSASCASRRRTRLWHPLPELESRPGRGNSRRLPLPNTVTHGAHQRTNPSSRCRRRFASGPSTGSHWPSSWPGSFRCGRRNQLLRKCPVCISQHALLSSASDWCLAAATLLALACATCCSRIFARPHFIARQHRCVLSPRNHYLRARTARSNQCAFLAHSHRGDLTVARSRSYTRTSA